MVRSCAASEWGAAQLGLAERISWGKSGEARPHPTCTQTDHACLIEVDRRTLDWPLLLLYRRYQRLPTHGQFSSFAYLSILCSVAFQPRVPFSHGAWKHCLLFFALGRIRNTSFVSCIDPLSLRPVWPDASHHFLLFATARIEEPAGHSSARAQSSIVTEPSCPPCKPDKSRERRNGMIFRTVPCPCRSLRRYVCGASICEKSGLYLDGLKADATVQSTINN